MSAKLESFDLVFIYKIPNQCLFLARMHCKKGGPKGVLSQRENGSFKQGPRIPAIKGGGGSDRKNVQVWRIDC